MDVFVTEIDVVVFGDVCSHIWSVAAPAIPSHTMEGGRLITRDDQEFEGAELGGDLGGVGVVVTDEEEDVEVTNVTVGFEAFSEVIFFSRSPAPFILHYVMRAQSQLTKNIF